MRRVLFALVILLVCASAATGIRVQASTDCERWIAEYRKALAHSPVVKRANVARRRLRHYVHRKIAALTKPKATSKPRVLPARFRHPKMTREEMLHRFDLACGELPEDTLAPGDLPGSSAPAFIANHKPGGDEMPLDPGNEAPDSMIAMNQPPSYFGGGDSPSSWGGGPGILTSGFGPYGGGGIPRNPPATGSGGDDPSTLSPPALPTAEAPEPGSLLLVATGFAGAAGILQRRMRKAA
jgi:hypothetical protein